MKKAKALLSIISAAVCMLSIGKTNVFNTEVNAAGGLVIDYSNIKKNPHNQFYFSDENEFFIDGITVYYNNADVTSQTNFIFNTSPASTYDGNNLDYTVPFTAEYDDKYINGQLDVKIGLRGDANCDNKVTLNDLILVENELFQNYHVGKSALTANDGFGIFLANADGMQKAESSQPFGTDDLNIADALFINKYLNNSKKSVYENVLLSYAAKPKNGEISISKAKCTAGDIVTLYISQKSDNTLGAFEFTCKWSNPDLKLVNVCSINSSISIFSAMKNDNLKIWGFGGNDTLKDGDFIALQFKVPENAALNTSYDVYVQNVNYFGSGINIANKVMMNDGEIIVASEKADPDPDIIPSSAEIDYDYGVRAWDAVVEKGTTSVDVPVMLLGGLKAKDLTLTVQCEEPLSVQSLNNAVLTSVLSDGKITGIYSSNDCLNVDFETLKVNISANAKPGKYPIKITVENIKTTDNITDVTVYDGSVTVKEKSILKGDADEDGTLTIRDAAYIARMLAKKMGNKISKIADYNADGIVNIRDAAAISIDLAKRYHTR